MFSAFRESRCQVLAAELGYCLDLFTGCKQTAGKGTSVWRESETIPFRRAVLLTAGGGPGAARAARRKEATQVRAEPRCGGLT